jgi:hypothetical protein
VEPELKYDPAVNRASLVAHGENWYLWMFRPDGATAEPHFITRNEVGDAILDTQLSNQNAVIQFFERCLIRLGYSVTSEDGPRPEDFIATWTLAPGEN